MTSNGSNASLHPQKGGCMNIPEHAGLKKVAFLSIGMVSKVEGGKYRIGQKGHSVFPK